jgi:hypothetical protein
MSTDHIFPIGGTGGPERTSTGPSSTDSAEFRRLLERLEKLSTKSEEVVVKDAKGLEDALRKAEDDFVSAMDLRRKLEEAFRRSQQ